MDFPIHYGSADSKVPKRREVRMPATLNVRILGIDAGGKPFHQPASTLDISLSGARVTGLAARLNQGDIVGLQSGGGKSRFKVCWVKSNRDGTYQIGLHCKEKGVCPWRDRIQLAKEGTPRNHQRYACNGSASLRAASFTSQIWGTLRDVSEGGCYVHCVNAAPQGDIVSGQFIINGVQLSGVAEVRTSLQAVGMGLAWCDLGFDGQARLDNILRALALDTGDDRSGKAKALAQVNKLHQVVSAVRERLESEHILVHPETVGQLSEALEKLTAALKSMQS